MTALEIAFVAAYIAATHEFSQMGQYDLARKAGMMAVTVMYQAFFAASEITGKVSRLSGNTVAVG